MKGRPVRAVLFDLDGTLVDSAPDLGSAVDEMRVARGMASLPLSDYRPMVGAGARGMLGVAFGIAPDDPRFDALRDEFFGRYETRLTTLTHPFEGVLELIEALVDRGVAWGVVTNKSERFALPLTRALPLFSTAGCVVGGDTTPHAKPHPAPLVEAARRLEVPCEDCVYVGDDLRDVMAGRAAGMRTVAAVYGYLGRDADPTTWAADANIERPMDLLSLIGA